MKAFLRGKLQSLDFFKLTSPYSYVYSTLSSVALFTLSSAKAANGQSFAKWLQIILWERRPRPIEI